MDPEYFNRTALAALAGIRHPGKLGDLVEAGYRVVYESTEAIERSEGEGLGLPYFLQAADITTPFINAESMVCVSQDDWVRYPKGRIKPGELLIEVKGKAEKVALVPKNFPAKTLVTGTCFKLNTYDEVDQFFLIAYLTCRYGQVLKDRLKTNLLVSYLAKDDLYSLPIPCFSLPLKNRIRDVIELCFAQDRERQGNMKAAESTLMRSLCLENWQAPEPPSYVRNCSEAFAAGRLDSQFFSPRVQALMKSLGRDGLSIGAVAPPRHHAFDPEKVGLNFQYIEIGDVRADATVGSSMLATGDAPSRATQHVKAGDVITSTVRPIRRLSAVVDASQDGAVCSSGFVVLNPTAISSATLVTYLRLPPVCELMDLHCSASLYPAISEKDLLGLPIPKIGHDVQQKVDAAVEAGRASTARAVQLLDAAKRAVEIAIEDSEAAALAYLETVAPRPH